MKITLIAVGKIKGSCADLYDVYAKRITGGVKLREVSGPTQKAEGEAVLSVISPKTFVVLMDEHGRDLTSRELAGKMTAWQDQGVQDIAFIIGGADGSTEEVKKRADFTLGLGRKTWPHMLARVMLIEQIYRAQQINAGHPYHRD